jgi:hypothetical protein
LLFLFIYAFLYLYLFVLWQGAVKQFSTKLFYEHKSITDAEVKEQFKSLLVSDDYCNSQLVKLEEKDGTFDQL